MKNKKRGLILIPILIVVFLIANITYSRLNVTITQDMAFVSKTYKPLTIINTTKIDDNSYQIKLRNDNDYGVAFSCEDINSSFNIVCNGDKIPANAIINFKVDLDFKEGVDTSTLTPNPNGDGYITKLGIRITSPYVYSKEDPHYAESDNMIVIKLVIKNLKDHITALASTDTTNMAIDHSTNIRFIGNNPSNYVRFNNELWRILGVFDGKVKIIRTTPLNTTGTFYDKDASGTNAKFQNAAIKTELNETYLNTIDLRFRSLIKEGNWNVGGLNTWNWQTAVSAYDTERSATISANVGLISATDYVYATGGSNRKTCIESTHIGAIGSCSADNWLYPYTKPIHMWTTNNFTGSSSGIAIIVNTDGIIAATEIKFFAAAYPVVYLDETAVFSNGDGTKNNPYNIKGNTDLIPPKEYYQDYINDVYIGGWGNSLADFAGKEINSFDKNDGALLFDNNTWGIPTEYTINQVTVYSYNWAELTTYYNRTWIEDNVWHARLSDYVFKRQTGDDLSYIGSDALAQHNGSLRFVIIVNPK